MVRWDLDILVLTETHPCGDIRCRDPQFAVYSPPFLWDRPGQCGGLAFLVRDQVRITPTFREVGTQLDWCLVEFAVAGAALPLFVVGAYFPPDSAGRWSLTPDSPSTHTLVMDGITELLETCLPLLDSSPSIIIGDLNTHFDPDRHDSRAALFRRLCRASQTPTELLGPSDPTVAVSQTT